MKRASEQAIRIWRVSMIVRLFARVRPTPQCCHTSNRDSWRVSISPGAPTARSRHRLASTAQRASPLGNGKLHIREMLRSATIDIVNHVCIHCSFSFRSRTRTDTQTTRALEDSYRDRDSTILTTTTAFGKDPHSLEGSGLTPDVLHSRCADLRRSTAPN